jgi:hypothetical protein
MSMQKRVRLRQAPRGGFSPWAAIGTIGGVLLAAGIVARRYSPDPSHPRIQRWYGALEKPSYKPPDLVFGAAWPVVQSIHSMGAYRLMRMEPSPERDRLSHSGRSTRRSWRLPAHYLPGRLRRVRGEALSKMINSPSPDEAERALVVEPITDLVFVYARHVEGLL